MSAHKEMSDVKVTLEQSGHIVEMPNLNNLGHGLDSNGNTLETSQIKIEQDLIRGYFHKINNSDSVLAVNVNKNGMGGYIGGNTFLELGFGYALNKKLYILNPYSREISYYDEIDAMQPIVLNGDLGKIE